MTLELAKKLCKAFGDPSGMFKQCVNCFHDNEDLWVKCMNYKDEKVRRKIITNQ